MNTSLTLSFPLLSPAFTPLSFKRESDLAEVAVRITSHVGMEIKLVVQLSYRWRPPQPALRNFG